MIPVASVGSGLSGSGFVVVAIFGCVFAVLAAADVAAAGVGLALVVVDVGVVGVGLAVAVAGFG